MPGLRHGRVAAPLLGLCLLAVRPAGAADAVAAVPTSASSAADASTLAKRSLAACDSGRNATARDERLAHFTEGEQLARQALAANDADAQAHFALFCNMGEAMRIDGESVQALVGLGKLMRELDRTLELDPNHLDAMSAKGTLLVRLPRVFGGDVPTGEKLLRRVAEEDPNAYNSRINLARVCADRGETDEAVRFATRALEIARAKNRPEKVAEAQDVLAKLGAPAH